MNPLDESLETNATEQNKQKLSNPISREETSNRSPLTGNQFVNSANQHLVIQMMRVMSCHVVQCLQVQNTFAGCEIQCRSFSATQTRSICSILPDVVVDAKLNGTKPIRALNIKNTIESANMMTTEEREKNEFSNRRKKQCQTNILHCKHLIKMRFIQSFYLYIYVHCSSEYGYG